MRRTLDLPKAVLGHALLAFTCSAFLGCASSSAGSSPEAGRSVGASMEGRVSDFTTGHGDLRYDIEEDRVLFQVEFPLAQVWPAMVAAFAEVGIDPDLVDPRGARIGMNNQTVIRRLAGERLSTYFSCGSTMAGPVANASRIQTTFMVTARSVAAGQTSITFFVDAVARLNDAADKDPKRCRSTRRLEVRLMEHINATLEGPGA